MSRVADQVDPRIIGRQPICLLAVAVCAGILLDAGETRFTWTLWFVAAALLGLGWSIADRCRRERLGSWLLWGAALAVGGLHHRIAWDAYPADSIWQLLSSEPTPTCITGRVAQEPWWNFPHVDPFDATPEGISSTLILAAEQIHTEGPPLAVHGQVRVYVAGQVSGVRYGDRLRVWGSLVATRPPGNPGEVDFVWYGRARRQPGLLVADHPNCLQIEKRFARGRLLETLSSARRRLDEAIWRYVRSEPDLASAILLGLRGYVDDDQRDEFMTTGTIHLLAISGLHVGILAGSFLALGRLLGVPATWLLLLTVAFVNGYAALVDFQPPVVRASILITVWCLSKLWLRCPSPYNSLALSALIVLALDPTALFQIGAQLSFLAVLAISVAQPWCAPRRETDPLLQLIAESRAWPWRALSALRENVRQLFLYSCFITLFTAPLVAYRFHLVSPIGLVVNPLLMLPIAIALKAGLATLIFASWLPPAAMLAGTVCDGSLVTIRSLVNLAAQVPGGHWWTCGPSGGGTLLFYAGVFILLVDPPRRIRPRAGIALALVLLLATWWFPSSWPVAKASRPLIVSFADVGHGGAILLQAPSGPTLLFDAGSMLPPAVTAQRIAGLLWYQRVPRLDLLVISHDDLDHYSAVARLAERFSIGAVLVAAETLREPSAPLSELLRRLQQHGIPLRVIAAGDTLQLDPTTTIRVLHPPANAQFHSDNAESLVLSVEFGAGRLLLTADVEGDGLEQLLTQPSEAWDVAMIPHHGSRFSKPAEFARWTAASDLVVCNDKFSAELLHGESEGPQQSAPQRVWVTGIDGAVRVEFADPLSVRSWRRSPWGR